MMSKAGSFFQHLPAIAQQERTPPTRYHQALGGENIRKMPLLKINKKSLLSG